ncbi:MAG TPA: phosphoglucosamine mutase [Acidimicrobiales bacterium]|nr:phosphoglucosamine mutase [Acidimicrobiales bacterium]
MRFGTDGVRGAVGTELTAEVALALGRATARALGPQPYAIGRDTRLSGGLIQAALSAGLAAEGASAIDVGVLPTPGVAFLARHWDIAGAVISASHNPAEDNGVKLFGPGGRKLNIDDEARVEAELQQLLQIPVAAATGRIGSEVGTLSERPDAAENYVNHLTAVLGGPKLGALRVVLDCANGAASELAPRVLRDLGADVSALCDRPDGTNINTSCGSTFPQALQEAVLEEGAAVGLAFDGDADRVLAVDEEGELIDGDRMLALFAADRKSRGQLAHDTVVVTVMTNLGFHIAMEKIGVKVVQTPVGDRWVSEAMDEGGYQLGGEQSGHIIFGDLSTTGDGLLTAIVLLGLMADAGEPLAELAKGAMTRLPQVLRSVRVADGNEARLESADKVWDEVRSVEAELGSTGRVVLRASGTEPLVRVMVEAPTSATAESAAERLVSAVTSELSS